MTHDMDHMTSLPERHLLGVHTRVNSESASGVMSACVRAPPTQVGLTVSSWRTSGLHPTWGRGTAENVAVHFTAKMVSLR